MKYFGLLSCCMHLPFFIFIWQISNFLSHQDYFSDWGIYLLLFFCSLVIFGNFLKIGKGKMKLYRPLWFMYKRNTIDISEIYKVIIKNRGQATGSAVSISIVDDNHNALASFLCQMMNFEIKSLKNLLEQLGIEVEISGNQV